MPLTAKGRKILSAMGKTYGSEKKAKQVFYAMINEKKLKGVEGKSKKPARKKPKPKKKVASKGY